MSFDVKSLYTNVPVNEAIELAANKLFDGESNDNKDKMEVDKETFIELAKLACKDLVFCSPSGFFRQIDGLGMGIQPASPLSNIWMSSFEEQIKEDATIFNIYVDDTLVDVDDTEIENRLKKINKLHPKLEFTLEKPIENTIPFLDMKIKQLEDGTIETMWYRKPTDTGITLNFHATAPFKYKRNVIQGLVHRIYNASSTLENFNIGMEDGIKMLKENQYPEKLSRHIINATLTKLKADDGRTQPIMNDTEERAKKWLVLPYRGHATDNYICKLTNIGALILPIITTSKVKDVYLH